MTVKQLVLDYLRAMPGTPVTNNELAFQLAVPEPSVRRATNQLERESMIHYHSTTSFGRNLWVVL
jgi:DNA-binding GntR family transcriptional regulator